MAFKLFILLIAITITLGCGNHSNDDIPLPDASNSPSDAGGATLPSDTNSNSDGNSGSGTTGTGSAPLRQGERHSTSTGGVLVAFKTQKIAIDSSNTFAGATTANGMIYYTVYSYLSYPNKFRKIYQFNPATGSSSLYCSWIESGTLSDGFASDGTYFYIYQGIYESKLRKIKMNDCNSDTSIYLPKNIQYRSYPTLSVESGTAYYPANTNNYYYPYTYGLLRVSLANQSSSTSVSETILSPLSTDWGATNALATRNGVKWAIFNPDYSHFSFWRFDSQNQAATSQVSNYVLDTYFNPFSASMLDDSTLVVFSSPYDLTVFYFDVSGF